MIYLTKKAQEKTNASTCTAYSRFLPHGHTA
jgi:hypothetical protein